MMMPPQMNTRKRPAPGASPMMQQNLMQQNQQPPPQPIQLPATTNSPQMTNDQFLRWSQTPVAGNINVPYTDPTSTYDPNFFSNFPTNTTAAAPPPAPSNQLARRPVNQHLMTRARPLNEAAEDWPDFSDVHFSPQQSQPPLVEQSEDKPEHEQEEMAVLEQKALVAKREAQAKRKQIPPFVQKLSSFLDEEKNTNLIRWSDSGDSFIVLDEDEFAKTLIPELFKHNNYASFVRQLNMYGFHKKVGLSDNSMRAGERKIKSPSEYTHPYFKKGRPLLLWLINKPKSATGKSKGRGKDEGGEIDDEDRDVDEEHLGPDGRPVIPTGQIPSINQSLIPANNTNLSRTEVNNIRKELQTIQQQQRMISSAITRLRKDHNQLYEQAVAFQSMHDRHESSINAILTFLATVYNRSLDGHGIQNFASMFANAMPPDPPGQGSGIVDVGDFGNQEDDPQTRYKKPQLLLDAPPMAGQNPTMGRAATLSPSVSSTPSAQPSQYAFTQQDRPFMKQSTQTAHTSGTVEELFDQRPSVGESSSSPPAIGASQSMGQMQNKDDIMTMINRANSIPTSGSHKLSFPAALSHFENANGGGPLTPKQRNDMLQMIASNTGTSSDSNNALVSPNPPPMLDLHNFLGTRDELDMLAKLQAEQDSKVQNLSNLLSPLSPTGSIPGLADNGQYFPNASASPTASGDPNAQPPLDFDTIFNSGDYFNNTGNGDIDFGSGLGGGDANGLGDFGFDGAGGSLDNPGMDASYHADESPADIKPGIVESLESSAVPSPEEERRSEASAAGLTASPNKRRKRGGG